MLPKISIIVPIYKVEKYLPQCIDSIIGQTYTNLEIILIDDGSPDNCGAICDEYAKKDSRIIVIHKENGGLSDARNAGLDITKGDLIGMVDSDDWIELDMYETLYNNMKKYNSDISCCGYYVSFVDENIYKNQIKEEFAWSRAEAVEQILNISEQKGRIVTWNVWNKLYKKEIFDNIRYPLGKTAQDFFVIVDVISEANKISVNPVPKYYYRQRKTNTTNSNYFNQRLHAVEAAEYILKIVESKYPYCINIAKLLLLRMNFALFQKVIFSKDYYQHNEYKKALSIIKKNYKFIMKSNNFTFKNKIKISTLKVNVRLYKLLQKLIDWKNKSKIIEKNEIMFE